MASIRAPRPAFLNPVASRTEADPPLLRSHVGAVWSFLEPFARRTAERALSRVSLERARRFASRKGAFAEVIGGQGAIRHALRHNEAEDLMQDVAVAFFNAVDRGAVRSSEHSVKEWIRVAIWRTAARSMRAPAALLFAAGADERGVTEGHAEDARAPQAREASPESLAVARSDYGAKVAPLLGSLSAKLRVVLDLWLAGAEHEEIAAEVGITVATSRVRLHRAIEELREALFPRAGPRPEGGGRRPFGLGELGWVERRASKAHRRDLTNGTMCANVRGSRASPTQRIKRVRLEPPSRLAKDARPCRAPLADRARPVHNAQRLFPRGRGASWTSRRTTPTRARTALAFGAGRSCLVSLSACALQIALLRRSSQRFSGTGIWPRVHRRPLRPGDEVTPLARSFERAFSFMVETWSWTRAHMSR